MGMLGLMKNVGSTVLHSNRPIKEIGAATKAAFKDTTDARIYKNEKLANKLGYEMKDGRLVKENEDPAIISNKDRLESMYRNDDGSWNKTAIGGTIAGGYMGVSAAGRVASGGGLYRDSDGNFDLIGIPFI